MSQDSAKLSPSHASLVQARNVKTTSCPIEIPLGKSPAKVQHWAYQASKFGSAPPKSFSGPKSTHASPREGKTTSFSTWADQARSLTLSLSDADLCACDDHEVPFLETAPSPPKPLLPVMPLLKTEQKKPSRPALLATQKRRKAKKPLSGIKESLEEEGSETRK
ncbi:hypothetical protein P154DRAFT_583046 [Amniculicola lignicola CBS 123094]|uniref:Uncharacterized protein n=1 Tax=Amniculicola lignicola CBS 123094 TaxID=1392246 RepID=A0A6A5VZ99_9PLEO|nr:hypothetical protein P154DRAFT_583046 [Amniculicola lignicola CBS 123094]